MPYKNYNFEVIASDFNSPLSRNQIWTGAFFQYPELLGISRVVLGIISKENKIEYFSDLSTWRECHEDLKAKVMKDYTYLEKIIDRFVEHGEKMNEWTKKNIFDTDLKILNNEKLAERLKIFVDMQRTEYALGVALVILDFQNFSFVENSLVDYLKSKVSEKDYAEYYGVFTQPIQNSFAQDQEEALLRLMVKYFDNQNWRRDARDKNLMEIKKEYPDFYTVLEEHTKKYAWVYYVYAGPAFTEKDFFDFIRDYLVRGVNPADKLKEITDRREQNAATKKKYLDILQPDDFHRAILNLAGKVVWAKPRRKDYQSRSYYHMEKLYKEIGRRLYLSLAQVRSCTFEMIEQGLRTGTVDHDLINELYRSHVCLQNDDGTITVLAGSEANDFSKKHIKRSAEIGDLSNMKEIGGVCACSGKAKGRVKIINLQVDMAKMEYGDILVSTATTPSIIAAMKKAAAIVTDEGGLTCHASIVSRELHIPCVVGTKIATRIFKDGDNVEVDAEKGIIKKI